MAKPQEPESKPTWVEALEPRTQREADLLRRLGPSVFLDYARRALKRDRGGVRKDHSDLIRRARLLWVTNLSWTKRRLASLAAKAIEAAEERLDPSKMRGLPASARLIEIIRDGTRILTVDLGGRARS